MKSGFVSIIGRPNVGKSTLLDAIIKERIAIISDVPGTTRNIIQGIYNEDDYQIVFVDTPGIHKPVNKLGKFLNKQATSMTKDVDVILFLVDASTHLGKGDKFIIKSLSSSDLPVILVLNKIDKIKKEDILLKIEEYKDLYSFAEIVPISAEKNDNVDHLIDVIKKYLTDDVKYFDDDMYTTNSINFMVAEFVREQLLFVTEEEIPHKITCVTTQFVEKKGIVHINVDIIVDKDSLKKIIIGKKGERLKTVGTKARLEIEKMLDKKVYLELYVKTIENWFDKEKYLAEMGFNE